MKKLAFTLAETLMTLMIIGVIAAMTIPALKKNTNSRENAVKLKKAYSAIANATDLLASEYGPVLHWRWDDNTVIMDEMYIKKLNVTKNCKTDGGCVPSNYVQKNLNGNGTSGSEFDRRDWYTFVTEDGLIWTYKMVSNTCSGNEHNYIKKACAYVEVDVNGTSMPNIVGIDIFGFQVSADGVYPFGGCPDCDSSDCTTSGGGWGCTAKVLREGQINY